MKKIKNLTLLTLFATTTITPALSQSVNFKGPSIAIYGANNKGEIVTDVGDPILIPKKTDTAYGIDAAYTFGLEKNFFLTLGATYQINDTNFGRVLDNTTGEDETVDYEATKQYSFYVAPMYALNNNTAVFLKASLNTININELYDAAGDTVGPLTLDIEFKNKFGYGIGVQHMFHKNLFVKLEYEQVDYGTELADDVNYSPETKAFKIAIGYKF